MGKIPSVTVYEMCGNENCWHFIEDNSASFYPGMNIAEYVHLDDGEKEYDHDAIPSGDIFTLDEWRNRHPFLFKEFPDDKVGPNSAHFQDELQSRGIVVHDAEYHEKYEAEHGGESCPVCRRYENLDGDNYA